jgi:cytochrome P450
MPLDALFDPAVVESPHAYFSELREHDPVHRIEGTDTYLVSRTELIHEVISNPSLFSSHTNAFLHLSESQRPEVRAVGGAAALDTDTLAILATADPPDHGRQRKVLTPIFSNSAINAREEDFHQLIDVALDHHVSSGHVEWMADVAEPLPMVMVARLLGMADETAPALKEHGYAAVELISGFVPEERRSVLELGLLEFGPVVDAFVAACAADEPDETTVIGACAAASRRGNLTDLEALGIFGILLAAGGESTTSLLGTGVRILAEQPELQDRLRAQPELIAAFVEEAVRIDPPFRGHYRRVVADTTLGDVPISQGSQLVLVWPAANRDPAEYDRADEVDIDRPNPRQHLGFGWGIHLCIGAPLARLEAKVTFERLLARTTSFSLAEQLPTTSLHHHKSLMVRRLVRLPLTLTA